MAQPVTQTQPITLAQISDLHLLADPNATLRGCNPWQNLQAILKLLSQQPPDLLLLTGDLAEAAAAGAYEQLQATIAILPCPVAWLPGNHDDLALMQHHLDAASFCQSPGVALTLGPWRLLLLNSCKPEDRWGEGQLSQTSLLWLHQELMQHPEPFVAIALHHHPIPVGIDWVDQMQVENGVDFLDLLADFSQVQLVLFGHIHHAFAAERQVGHHAIAFYGCPATVQQVSPAGQTPQVPSPQVSRPQVSRPQVPSPDWQKPGLRWLQLNPTGQHNTWIERLR